MIDIEFDLAEDELNIGHDGCSLLWLGSGGRVLEGIGKAKVVNL